MTSNIYLASTSPRRRELLQQIGVAFDQISAPVEEKISASESPLDYVQRLALDKARAGLAEVQRQGLKLAPVLGADTLGVLGSQLLEKPRDQIDAANMLRSLSGQTHQVITALALTDGLRIETAMSITQVSFRQLSDREIATYWETGEPCDKAGSYAIQGLGAVFVQSIQGSYSNVVGLPLEACCDLLKRFDIPWWQQP